MSNKQTERLYIAYGSNLNLEQMARRCPAAEIVGKTYLHNFRLMFRGKNTAVATIEKQEGGKVPVLVWRLQPDDEHNLDIYEGYPHLYHKEMLKVTVNGKRVSAMVYIMNETKHPYGTPSRSYFDAIRQGYESAGFDPKILRHGVLESCGKAIWPKNTKEEVRVMTETIKKQIEAIQRSGETNMLDVNMVQWIANRKRYYELVIYLEEHRKEYVNYLFTSKAPEKV